MVNLNDLSLGWGLSLKTCKPVPGLCQSLFDDKGYLAKWQSDPLAEQHVHLIMKVQRNEADCAHTVWSSPIAATLTHWDSLRWAQEPVPDWTYPLPLLPELRRQPHGRCRCLLSCAQQATLARGDHRASSLIPILIPNWGYTLRLLLHESLLHWVSSVPQISQPQFSRLVRLNLHHSFNLILRF